jgi:hypothetical protein
MGSRKRTGRHHAKTKAQDKQKNRGNQHVPAAKAKRSRMEVLYQASAALAILAALAIGILLYYHIQSWACWLTFSTCVFVAFAFCCFWQDKIWKAAAEKEQINKANAIAPAVPKANFAIKVQTVLRTDSRQKTNGFWLIYNSKYGLTRSPAQIALYLQVVNLQSVPSMIEVLNIEADARKQNWQKLLQFTIRGNLVVFALNDLSKAPKIDFEQGDLLSLLSKRPLQPHETVRGWVLCEIPVDLSPSEYRFYLRDTAGIEFTKTDSGEPASSGSDALSRAELKFTKESHDIRRLHFTYYSEFHGF